MADRSPSRRELLELMRRHDRMFEEFRNGRRRTIDTLLELVRSLNSSKKKVRISKITGSVGGIVSAGLTVAGLATLPFPPVGVPLSLVGSALGVACGVIGGGANLGDILKSKNICRHANLVLREDNQAVVNYQEARMTLELAVRTFKGLTSIGSVVASSIQLIRLADIVLDSAGAAMRGASAAVDAIPIVGAVFNLITLPLDIGILISNSVDIHNSRPHSQAVQLNELIQQLEHQLRELQLRHDDEMEQMEEMLLQGLEPQPITITEIAFYICIIIFLVCCYLYLFFFSSSDSPPLLAYDVLMLPFD